MSNYGLKISKQGVDVNGASDNQLIFTSKYPALKIQDRGFGAHTFLSTADPFDIVVTETVELKAHGQGYRPFFLAYIDKGDGWKQMPLRFSETTANGSWRVHLYATSTTTQLLLVCSATWAGPQNPMLIDPVSAFSLDYNWTLFYDPIEND